MPATGRPSSSAERTDPGMLAASATASATVSVNRHSIAPRANAQAATVKARMTSITTTAARSPRAPSMPAACTTSTLGRE